MTGQYKLKCRIQQLLDGVIKNFQLSLPIKLLVTEPERAKRIWEKYNVKVSINQLAISAMGMIKHEAYFLYYNAPFWLGASDKAIMGNLAHELAHRELLELNTKNPPAYFYGFSNKESFIISEWFTDIVAVAKGYGQAMVDNKEYIYICSQYGGRESIGINIYSLNTLNSQITGLNWDKVLHYFSK